MRLLFDLVKNYGAIRLIPCWKVEGNYDCECHTVLESGLFLGMRWRRWLCYTVFMHLMKLVYYLLPTTNLSKEGERGSLPTVAFVTFDHLLQFTHRMGQEFQSALTLKVFSYCKKKMTPDNFHATLVIALENWVKQHIMSSSICDLFEQQ